MNRTSSPTTLDADSHPRAAVALQITSPTTPDGRYLVHHPGAGRYVKLGAAAHDILRALDGRRTLVEIADSTGGRVPVDRVVGLVRSFEAHGLLEQATPPRRDGVWVNDLLSDQRRVRRTGLVSVQLSLFDPSAWFDRIPRATRALTGAGLWIGAVVALVAGAVAVAVAPSRILGPVSGPVAAAPVLAAVFALLPTMFLHELAHAAVAWRYGARARRLGVMLFYLAPALFCDVSDCWRLPRRRQRVAVASAGIALQSLAAGIAVALAVFLGPVLPRAVDTALAIYGVANALLGALNLVPLVRLDGYLALMSALDVSNLRAKAIAEAGNATRRALLGAPARPPTLSCRRLAVAYGAACAVFPLVLVGFALLRAEAVFLSLGAAGAVAWLGVLTGLAVAVTKRAVSGARALARRVSDGEIDAWRAVIVPLALVGAIGTLLLAVSVRSSERGAFSVAASRGPVVLVDPSLAHALRVGARVTLRRPGLLRSPVLGHARVLPGPRVRLTGVAVPGAIATLAATASQAAAPIAVDGRVSVARGEADVAGGRSSLVDWARRAYLAPAFALIGL
jgi:putative peptide zinc metalloprotease protein